MGRPYSLDLRNRVVARFEAMGDCRAVAALFRVSASNVVKWTQRKRQTGSPAAKPMGGHRPRVLAKERDWLLMRVADKPDLTLRELLAQLHERGVVVSYGPLWRFFAAEGISFKKNTARQRAGSPRRRQAA
jgi:transposase